MNPSSTLYLVMMSFPPERADASNRRFDYEHVPDLLSCPGFLGVERFVRTAVQATGWKSAPAGPDYMNFWELATPDALLSDAYQLRSKGPDETWKGNTPHAHWRAQQSEEEKAARVAAPGGAPAGSGQPRTVWTRRPSPWSAPALTTEGARAVLVALYDVDADDIDAVNAYLDEEEVTETLNCPGFLACERYGAATVPAQPADLGAKRRYLDIYDVTSPEVPSSPQYARLRAAPSPRGTQMRARMSVLAHGVYTQRPSPWTLGFGSTSPKAGAP